jgi:NAD(P)-dependent dehydrogenase (short-subunit alcohol dehydrogenase family)
VVIVTGAGRGIGRDYALGLASRGAKVIVNETGPGDLPGKFRADDVVTEIRASGGMAVALTHDITDQEAAAATCALTLEHFGRVDILINNAGVLRQATFADLDLSLARWIIDVHLNAAFNVTQQVWREMIKGEA